MVKTRALLPQRLEAQAYAALRGIRVVAHDVAVMLVTHLVDVLPSTNGSTHKLPLTSS
jgi:hypothetical protein